MTTIPPVIDLSDVRKTYATFLSHFKTEASGEARVLKLELVRALRAKEERLYIRSIVDGKLGALFGPGPAWENDTAWRDGRGRYDGTGGRPLIEVVSSTTTTTNGGEAGDDDEGELGRVLLAAAERIHVRRGSARMPTRVVLAPPEDGAGVGEVLQIMDSSENALPPAIWPALRAAERARRISLCGASSRRWSPV